MLFNSANSDFSMTHPLPTTARSFPIALVRAREGVMASIREMLAETGITEQQWRVLRVMSEIGSLDTSALGNRASLLVPSLTRIVMNLSKKGLITQTHDVKDKRRQFIAITPAGQKIIDDHAAQSSPISKLHWATRTTNPCSISWLFWIEDPRLTAGSSRAKSNTAHSCKDVRSCRLRSCYHDR